MSSLKKSINRSRAISRSTFLNVSKNKASGGRGLFDLAMSQGSSQLSRFRDQGANKQRYSLFRGWVHAAINALAMQGAGQPVHMARTKASKGKQGKDKPGTVKTYQRDKMPKLMGAKTAKEDLDIVDDHPFLAVLENPNKIQSRWEFVYSFIANLNITGWAFIVKDEDNEGNPLFYSLPTTWVTPDHSKGAFAEFRISDPSNPTSETDAETLDGDQVRFAYIPHPANPLAALAPAQAQINAIKIDDHIQGSQEVFFENGIFPSVIITMGSNPHPDVPGGVRPRLTASQRRQVFGAIRKLSSGIANYGNPAIIDGMIEKIERLSATQNEMGWDRSEKSTRTRILSAFAVHPFILGDEMAGSYAQAYVVEKRFCTRVNTFLDMLSIIMTEFSNKGEDVRSVESQEKLFVWYEACEANDPSMTKSLWENARKNEDISQNEFRSFMGLPPDEDGNEKYVSKSLATPVINVSTRVAKGEISQEQGRAILVSMGIPNDLTILIAGERLEQFESQQAEVLKNASETLKQVSTSFNRPAEEIVKSIIDGSKRLNLPVIVEQNN